MRRREGIALSRFFAVNSRAKYPGPNERCQNIELRGKLLSVFLRYRGGNGPPTSEIGTFETCRRTLRESVYWGRPEVIGARSERRD